MCSFVHLQQNTTHRNWIVEQTINIGFYTLTSFSFSLPMNVNLHSITTDEERYSNSNSNNYEYYLKTTCEHISIAVYLLSIFHLIIYLKIRVLMFCFRSPSISNFPANTNFVNISWKTNPIIAHTHRYDFERGGVYGVCGAVI